MNMYKVLKLLFFSQKTSQYSWRTAFSRSENNHSLEHELSLRFPHVTFLSPQNITIEDRVSIGGHVIISAGASIFIGHDTMIAARTIISCSTHNHENHPMWKHGITRPISIGAHVWIGSAAIILPGVKVGSYSVVGAGSVVNKHVPELAIVAGNPARIIKYRDLSNEDLSVEYPGTTLRLGYLPDDKRLKSEVQAEL